ARDVPAAGPRGRVARRGLARAQAAGPPRPALAAAAASHGRQQRRRRGVRGSGVMSDGLFDRAKQNSQGTPLPEHCGELIELEVGEFFDGRDRGHDASVGRSGVYLLWDGDGERRFIWANARLDRCYEDEKPSVGDRVVIYRDENYRTRFDGPEEATGL